jgi:hypothetical protein
MTERDRLHALVDTLPEEELSMALHLLESRYLVKALLDAPLDDEPLTAEDEAALEEAERDIAEGRVVAGISEASFHDVWDNEDDAAYDGL